MSFDKTQITEVHISLSQSISRFSACRGSGASLSYWTYVTLNPGTIAP